MASGGNTGTGGRGELGGGGGQLTGEGTGGSTTAVSCPAGEKKCVNATTLSVCALSGDKVTLFDCPTGCDGTACEQADLQTGWTIYRFKATDDTVQVSAAYVFEQLGRVATESENALPTAYVNEHAFETLHATGKISVQTTSDDDFIGFVFGWQDMSHFYLFDWKKAEQNDGTCGIAKQGMSLKLMSAASEPLTCDNYWASAGTAAVTSLSPPAGPGWVSNVVYSFDLVWKPGDITITVKDGSTVVGTVTSKDASIKSGRFGFWNYSQSAVRYEAFTIEPAP